MTILLRELACEWTTFVTFDMMSIVVEPSTTDFQNRGSSPAPKKKLFIEKCLTLINKLVCFNNYFLACTVFVYDVA